MASERVPVPVVTPVIENVPLPETEVPQPPAERVPQQSRGRASDPFGGSRDGSPRQYASRNNSGASSDQHHISLPPDPRRVSALEKYEDEDPNLHGVPVLTRQSSYGPAVPTPARYPTSEMRPRAARQRTGETGHVSYHPPRSMMDYMAPSVEAKVCASVSTYTDTKSQTLLCPLASKYCTSSGTDYRNCNRGAG